MRAALVALLLAASPALAQDRPLTLPTRDVDVLYRTQAGAQSYDQRWRFRAEDQKLRLDLPSPGVYMIADHRQHRAAMVSDGDKGVLDMALPNTDPGGLRPGQSFTRAGTATVAGVACTEWQTKDLRGAETTACITADGVLLRARHGDAVVVEATKIAYGPLDPAAFAIPAAYKHEPAPDRR
ncbi:MAG: hypothetical protein NVSMB18_12190 [Acetobacteraceae bacterium]